jgi:hypothetical protein
MPLSSAIWTLSVRVASRREVEVCSLPFFGHYILFMQGKQLAEDYYAKSCAMLNLQQTSL